MTGSYRKRGSTWTVYWWVSGPDGRQHQRSKGGFATKREATAHLTTVMESLGAGTYVDPSKLTVAAYLTDHWLPRLTVKPGTVDSYRRAAKGWIIPALGTYRLAHLTPKHVADFYASMQGAKRRDGRGTLGARTPRLVAVTLSKALGDAVKTGLLPRNVAASVPRPPEASANVKAWAPAQLGTFLASATGERLYPLIHLAATTGMRRGELCGLRWSDVDLDAGRLSVRQTRVVVDYAVLVSEPKTAKSRRQLNLDPATVATLRRWKVHLTEERLAWGAAYDDSGLVFPREDGSGFHPQAVTLLLSRLIRRSGLPRITLHGLRHSYATAGLASGEHPKVISERLGHATVAMTLDIYSHVVEGMDADAANRVAALILGGSQ